MLKITARTAIEQETIKNLLSAQRRIAESGNAKDVIRISRYLLRLAEKRGNVLVDTIPEGEEQRCGNPVYDLQHLHEDAVGSDTQKGE